MDSQLEHHNICFKMAQVINEYSSNTLLNCSTVQLKSKICAFFMIIEGKFLHLSIKHMLWVLIRNASSNEDPKIFIKT